MKDTHFKIVIGDILRDSSIKDVIHFKEKFSSLFPQVVEPGIEVKLVVQWMDHSTLLLMFEYIQAKITCVCDKCGIDFTHTIRIENKQVKCFFDGKKEVEEEEDVLSFASGDTTIDIEEYIVQSLQLEDNYVHVCTTCQKNDSVWNEDILEKKVSIKV